MRRPREPLAPSGSRNVRHQRGNSTRSSISAGANTLSQCIQAMGGKATRKWQQGRCPATHKCMHPDTKIKFVVGTLVWTTTSRLYPFITGGQSAASIAFNCAQLRFAFNCAQLRFAFNCGCTPRPCLFNKKTRPTLVANRTAKIA